jgi:hypothetical protein
MKSWCIFHFGHCLWRKIQNLELTAEYENNREIRRCVKRFFNIPFVPVSKVVEYFNYSKAELLKVEKKT